MHVLPTLLFFAFFSSAAAQDGGSVCSNPPSDSQQCQAGDSGQTWGWSASWRHYFCGGGKEVDLADTGLEPVVKKAWEDAHLEAIKMDVCAADDPGSFKKTYGVKRPPVSSPYYWIGGFSLKVEATSDEMMCDNNTGNSFTVKASMKDNFDCQPDAGLFGDTYDVTHQWTFTVCCPKTTPPTPSPTMDPYGNVWGDPHFTTWGGQKFDYHGECDLVWIHHPSFQDGHGLYLHIRTTRHAHFSYIQHAALKIGDDLLQLSKDGSFFVNGEAKTPEERDTMTTFAGFPVVHEMIRWGNSEENVRHRYTLELENGASICLETFKTHFVCVEAHGIDSALFEGSLGVLGDFPSGDFVGRDGTTILPTSSSFVEEWQVRDEDLRLFHATRSPQFPEKCLPPYSEGEKQRRLGEDKVLRRVAEEACGHAGDYFEECVFDVVAIGDVDVAQAY